MERSITPQINVIRHDFERRIVSTFTWTPVKYNLADRGNTIGSPVIDGVRLMVDTVHLLYYFPTTESVSSSLSLSKDSPIVKKRD